MSDFWINWLRYASLFLVAYGLAMVLILVPPLDGLILLLCDLALSPSIAMPATPDPLEKFLIGLCGAILIGWATMIYFVANFGLRSGEAWAARAIMTSIAAWFLIDNAVSYTVGAYANIGFNCIFALIFALPFLLGSGAKTGKIASAR